MQVQLRMWVLEAQLGTVVVLLVLALVALVLVLHVLMLLWVRTFVLCWVSAQLMVLVM